MHDSKDRMWDKAGVQAKQRWFSSYVELRELELDSSQELLCRCLEKLLLKL